MLAEAIENAGGAIGQGSGPGLDAVFPSAVAALDSAVACQRTMQDASWEDDGRPMLRIGIDIGEAERGGDGWSGPVMARAAAIGEAAAGDQIVCSTSVIDLAGPNVGELRATELGLYRLPGLPPVSLHRISASGIEDRAKPLPAGRLTGRPVSDENRETFGRDEEIELVTDRLRLHRLVTIVGPGGAGKTHLAEHVATRLQDDFPGGAWMAGLASIIEAVEVEAEVLAGIGGHRHTDATVVESIVHSIGDQATLIVLDNCEHVTDSVASLATTMLDRCPNVRLLATSREPLGLKDEVLQPIDQLDRAAACALFKAEAGRQGFAVELDDKALDRICERLDDLPLAIRLAAARTRTLGLAEVESLLTDRLDLLRSSDHDQLAHHKTLRAAIAWSVDALASGPREVLIDLSVFAGRFTLDGVMAIAARTGRTRGEVLDHFDELVRRSLITGPTRIDGEARYRLLESVRLFVGELSDDQAAADRHLAFYRDRAERFDRMLRDESNLALEGFRSEWDDLRRARAHAADSGQMEMLTALLGATAGFAIELLWFDFLDWCEASFSLDDCEILDPPHARALSAAALMLAYRGEAERAYAITERSLQVFAHDDITLYVNGWTQSALQLGDHGRASFETVLVDRDGTAGPMRCAALCLLSFVDEDDGIDSEHRIHALSVLAAGGGDIYNAAHRDAFAARLMDRDPPAAIAAFEESVGLADRIGHRPLSLAGRSGVAYVSTTYGTIREALVACRDSIVWPWDNGMLTSMPFNLARTAKTLERAEKSSAAATILASVDQLDPTFAAEEAHVEYVDELRAANPEGFESWWAAGTGLSLQAAITFAVSVIDDCLSTAPGSPGAVD